MPAKQLALPLGTDPIAMLSGFLGGSHLMLEEAARSFLCDGRVCFPAIDVPEWALTEAAAQIWTADDLAELRNLQQAFAAMRRPDGDDELEQAAYDRAWLAAWKAESLCRARLIRSVSPRLAHYWKDGWR